MTYPTVETYLLYKPRPHYIIFVGGEKEGKGVIDPPPPLFHQPEKIIFIKHHKTASKNSHNEPHLYNKNIC